MTEVSSNEQFHASSFLQGHNAEYVEQLHAAYVKDPSSVDPSWAQYFASLGEAPDQVVSEAEGAPWARADWPPGPSDENTAALDGNWDAFPDAATLEKKIRAKKANG
ncbi:MAG: 2-oxoglutarate dehydrogenase E1 component, partial [Pseudomonadota bacterium]